MRKLIVSMNITLDGYMAGPNCELDWHFKSWTDEMGDELCLQLSHADTILLGRVTYTAMARFWPAKIADPCCRGEDFAFANMMNYYSKIVFSATLRSPEWNNSKIINGSLQSQVMKMKKRKGKNIMVYGSGQLVSALGDAELVDEYQLWLHPVVLGKGKPLFKSGMDPGYFQLVELKRFESGVVVLYYRSKKTRA